MNGAGHDRIARERARRRAAWQALPPTERGALRAAFAGCLGLSFVGMTVRGLIEDDVLLGPVGRLASPAASVAIERDCGLGGGACGPVFVDAATAWWHGAAIDVELGGFVAFFAMLFFARYRIDRRAAR